MSAGGGDDDDEWYRSDDIIGSDANDGCLNATLISYDVSVNKQS